MEIVRLRSDLLESIEKLEQLEGHEGADQAERIRAEGKRFMDLALQVWSYYQDTYKPDRPAATRLTSPEHVWRLKNPRFSFAEQCKQAGVRPEKVTGM